MTRTKNLLLIIRQRDLPLQQRAVAFEHLLREVGDDGATIKEFAISQARRSTSGCARWGIPQELLDPEGVADEALVDLFVEPPVADLELRDFIIERVQLRTREAAKRERMTGKSVPIDADPTIGIEVAAPEKSAAKSFKELRKLVESQKRMQAALSALSPKLRQVAELLSHSESFVAIGRELGISADTARKRWERARRQLQALLQGL